METKKEEEWPVVGQRYYRPASSGTTARAVLPVPQDPVLPVRRQPEKFRCKVRANAALPPPAERYYRPSGTTACQERYYRVCGMSSTLSCLLLYPFVAYAINRPPFSTLEDKMELCDILAYASLLPQGI